ncbi:MAG: hypothetical protein ISS34_02950 [Candidatus Omnitrophica bacterium]|nr:hypothetical protein [Candidatus Omnitrophota bacterium]
MNDSDKRLQRTKRNVNVDFFKKWSPEMAYVLGFFAADGGIFKNSMGSKYIQLVSTDKEILIAIKKMMNSKHKIGIKKKYAIDRREKECYLIQIGSKEMYNDLLKLGFMHRKDLMLNFPKIPKRHLNHFIRGYFDGDGSISTGFYKRRARNDRMTHYILTSFTSGSREFLSGLSRRLRLAAYLGNGYLRCKSNSRTHQLFYSTNDSRNLFEYMYKDINSEVDFYLKRKYNKFIKAFKN